MKLSVSIYSLYQSLTEKKITLKDALKFYKDQGIEYIEFIVDVFNEDCTQKNIKPLLDQYGIKVSSYSVSNEFANVGNLDAEIEKIREGIDWAVYFGASKVRVFSANFQKDDITVQDAIDLCAGAFKKITPYAEAKNVTLCLENHGQFINRSEYLNAIIGKVNSPRFKACADVGNFIIGLEEPLSAVKNLGDRIGHVHFKDFLISENGTRDLGNGTRCSAARLGQGSVPLKEIVKYLNESGYGDMTLSLEYEAGGDDITNTAESYAYMKQIAG